VQSVTVEVEKGPLGAGTHRAQEKVQGKPTQTTGEGQMKKILIAISLVFFASAAAAAEMPESDARFDNAKLESFGCCSLPQ
jgi:hypothetical protein